MEKIIKFGIIGCGVISNWHAQAVQSIDGAELVGVTDVYEPARVAFAEKYGHEPIVIPVVISDGARKLA